jgi:hypothetical protein
MLTNVSISLCENPSKRKVLGWVERVVLLPYNFTVHAKLDSGADYSSLGASDVEEFDKDGSKWVSFILRNRYGDEVKIERPIVRTATIKGHVKNTKRRVVTIGICVSDIFMEEEVNLVDRDKFEYQMLVGRSFLAGRAYIDPASVYLSDPICNSKQNKS